MYSLDFIRMQSQYATSADLPPAPHKHPGASPIHRDDLPDPSGRSGQAELRPDLC